MIEAMGKKKKGFRLEKNLKYRIFAAKKFLDPLFSFWVSLRSDAEADDGGAAGEERSVCRERAKAGRESRALVAVGMQPVSSCQKQKRQ